MSQSTQNYTDITDLITRAQDSFNMGAWGQPESEPRPVPKEQQDHIEMHEIAEDEPLPDITPYLRAHNPKVKVPKSLKEIGVEAVENPIQYPTYKTVKVPLSDQKIVQGMKMPLDSSFRWLAEICIRLLRVAHVKLKEAHGTIRRVVD